MNLVAWPPWLQNSTLWLTVLAGAVGALWALSEIVGKFGAETGRALRTAGAWLLMIVNFLAAAVIFLMTVGVAPGARTWPGALLVGLSWPTLFRNLSLKLGQPLDEDKSRENAALRVEKVYADVQKLALQLINSRITRQRTRLLTAALSSDLAELEGFARRMIAISPQPVADELIDQVMQRNVNEEAKKAYLAALVMNTFTRSALEDFIREQRQR